MAKNKRIKYDKLDNTANLFPVIVSETVSNVYRVTVTLKEEVDGEILQNALDKTLPFFDVFKVKLKKGLFWYYFETNNNTAPVVHEEDNYPCTYIDAYSNKEYLFRVTYYKKRINLEVFHVLTDGNGALIFLKELTYQYLREKYSELAKAEQQRIQAGASFNTEDNYISNYKHSAKKGYKTEKAVIVKGEKFPKHSYGIMQAHMKLSDVKKAAAKYNVTINQYLLGVLSWAIYTGYMHKQPNNEAICACVPVNLRPYFNSNTMKNFFTVLSSVFKPLREDYSFDEVVAEIAAGLNEQMNKENLERLFSYNVASEKNIVIRSVPLFIKNMAMKKIYKSSARANTMTVTNIGLIKVAESYDAYIEEFGAVLSMSKGQNIKGAICSYKDSLVFSISSAVVETNIQREVFKKLTEDDIEFYVETNGVYYE